MLTRPISEGNLLTEHNVHQNYRPDVDGLRAIAILGVLGYHAFPGEVPGGFLGVDVFFVISGYLISTIIFRSLEQKKFSFAEFYAHRIRRIFPALILVLIVSLLIARNVMLPNEFAVFGRHAAAGAGFVENFVLWRESSYFDVATTLKPLMHLWSLAIEEQFYLVFPIISWLAWRTRLKWPLLVAAIGLISFLVYVFSSPISAFFSPLSRAWELMLGAACACLAPKILAPKSAGRSFYGSSFSILGLFLIGLSFFGSLTTSLFARPVLINVMATLGTALLILSGPAASLNRLLLSTRPFVFVGLISYPLYLWHWPIFSFWTIIEGKSIDLTSRVLAVSLSLALAWLTFQFVEYPIRTNKRAKFRLATGLAGFMALAVALGLTAGHWGRHYDANIQKIIDAWDFAGYPEPPGAFHDPKYNFVSWRANTENEILLIGDSHAEQYINAIVASLNSSADRPSPQLMFYSVMSRFGIPQDLLNKIANDQAITRVVVSYFWSIKYGSPKIDYEIRCCGTGLFQTVGTKGGSSPSENEMRSLDAELEQLLTALRRDGREVDVILDNPFGSDLAPRSLVRRNILSGIQINAGVALSRAEAIERTEPYRSRVREIATRVGARVIDPMDSLCNDTGCPAITSDGFPVLKDYDHLSLSTLIHHVGYLNFLR
ncbi:putative O-antigen acetylase [Bradyrhizobium sp. STM 3843]|uniref:acyltransferase family protein n=1 Tax=Bradyrhizobium sp. STM 3843 TaxID=551947 RepID=UPI0002403A25|nr:acyltransferase family protein [Bradyrhizobium sp. STM 3843]CCE08488.1 putative O-antigen acetylase [Bradyrhizobium sp. STM 3843]